MKAIHPVLLQRSLAMTSLLSVSAGARAVDFNANAALTSDYVWRGTTQTLDEPAVQTGFKLSVPTGTPVAPKPNFFRRTARRAAAIDA